MNEKAKLELIGIRDNLEIYAAQCDRVERRKDGSVYFDKEVYGMFGDINSSEARSIARGITLALTCLNVEA
jgi:hypothetical protein